MRGPDLGAIPGDGHPATTASPVEAPRFRPLEGVRVVDLTTSIAGPACTQLLASLGAEVVKIEPPGGDPSRTWGPPFVGGEGAMFLATNAGKRSVVLDLSSAEDLERLLRLADGSQVFVQSLRPGAADRHGLGPETLRARNPKLVYCSIGAFGVEGPLSDQPGYDPLLQAASGIMSVTGSPDQPPARIGVSLLDLSTGLWAAFAILMALGRGEGATIDVSLYETALWMLCYQLVGYLGTGDIPDREGSAFAHVAPYQVFATRDGELMIVAGNDKLYRRFCHVLGVDDLAGDARFATNPDRVARRAELAALLEVRTRERETGELLGALVAAGVPASPVRSVAEAAEHEQTRALGILQQLGGFTTLAQPLSIDGRRLVQAAPPPALGEGTDEILDGLERSLPGRPGAARLAGDT